MTDYVATLIARPADAAHLRDAVALLIAKISPDRLNWLAEDEAVDLYFNGLTSTSTQLKTAIADLPIDLIVQRVAHRRKKLLIADMDSTMIDQECIDELADLAGFGAQVSAITESAMRGEIDFEGALRQRASLLTGLPLSVVEELLNERITLTEGARTLIATMKANGARTILVSGGFTDFAGPVGDRIGFDSVHANVLIAADGRLTGGVQDPIVGPAAKKQTLLEAIDKIGLDILDTLAVGDGANDIAMVEAAGLGIAFHPKPALAAVADARIDHTDLTALLFAQGYRRADFIA